MSLHFVMTPSKAVCAWSARLWQEEREQHPERDLSLLCETCHCSGQLQGGGSPEHFFDQKEEIVNILKGWKHEIFEVGVFPSNNFSWSFKRLPQAVNEVRKYFKT